MVLIKLSRTLRRRGELEKAFELKGLLSREIQRAVAEFSSSFPSTDTFFTVRSFFCDSLLIFIPCSFKAVLRIFFSQQKPRYYDAVERFLGIIIVGQTHSGVSRMKWALRKFILWTLHVFRLSRSRNKVRVHSGECEFRIFIRALFIPVSLRGVLRQRAALLCYAKHPIKRETTCRLIAPIRTAIQRTRKRERFAR